MGLFYALLVVVWWNGPVVHVETRPFDSYAACEDFKDQLKLQPGSTRFAAECQLTNGYRT